MKKLSDEAAGRVAQVVHEAVRAWQKANGQKVAPAWGRAPDYMRRETRGGVIWRLDNPKAPHSANHDQWVEQKRKAGWRYGKVKNGVKKTHPMIVPYGDLSEIEKRKDALPSSNVNLKLASGRVLTTDLNVILQ